MSDEELSKRERQKQRRAAKVAEQRKQERVSRLRQVAVIGLVVLVVLAGAGLLVWNQARERSAAAERAERATARLDELGCTPVEEQSAEGGGQHLPGQALAQNPPDALYDQRPTAAGPHLASVLASGVYDDTVDERLVVHNLEHGYVVFWWDPDAAPETITAVQDFVSENLDEFPKLIAAPYNTDLPDEQAVTTVAWSFRQECGEFDADVARAFMDEHYGLAGVAPEKNISPHDEGGQGVLTTDGQPLLFPPLDASAEAPTEGAPEGDPGHEGDETANPSPASS